MIPMWLQDAVVFATVAFALGVLVRRFTARPRGSCARCRTPTPAAPSARRRLPIMP